MAHRCWRKSNTQIHVISFSFVASGFFKMTYNIRVTLPIQVCVMKVITVVVTLFDETGFKFCGSPGLERVHVVVERWRHPFEALTVP